MGLATIIAQLRTGNADFNDVADALELSSSAALIWNTATQSFSNNTNTRIAFNATVFDNASMSDLAGDRLVVQADGIYRAGAFIRLPDLDDTEVIELNLYMGPSRVFTNLVRSPGSNLVVFAFCDGMASLSEGDIIEAYCTHTEGGSISTSNASEYMYSRLWAFRVR
jgi:hypothetical protein